MDVSDDNRINVSPFPMGHKLSTQTVGYQYLLGFKELPPGTVVTLSLSECKEGSEVTFRCNEKGEYYLLTPIPIFSFNDIICSVTLENMILGEEPLIKISNWKPTLWDCVFAKERGTIYNVWRFDFSSKHIEHMRFRYNEIKYPFTIVVGNKWLPYEMKGLVFLIPKKIWDDMPKDEIPDDTSILYSVTMGDLYPR